MERAFGYKKDIIDQRDFKAKKFFKSIKRRESIDKVDLRSNMSKIEDQGEIGSCVANASVGSLEYLHNRRIMNRTWCLKKRDYSRLFIYWFARDLDEFGHPGIDSGTSIRVAIKAMKQYGICQEKYWPYKHNKWMIKPDDKAIQKASMRKVHDYFRVEDLDDLIDALSKKFPVIFGHEVYPSFMDKKVEDTGIISLPDRGNEELLGGHCQLAVGFNREKRIVIVRNSWGIKWGDNGHCYMPFMMFNKIASNQVVSDAWVIRSHPND